MREAERRSEEAMRVRLKVEAEQAMRRRRLAKPDPDQADHDEYIEEMSLGGQPFRG